MTRLKSDITRFWKTMLKHLPEFVKVYVSKEATYTSSWLDALGKVPEDLDRMQIRRAHLFFVDVEPEANWAHHCYWIILRDRRDVSSAEYIWIKHNWPPQEHPAAFIELTRPTT